MRCIAGGLAFVLGLLLVGLSGAVTAQDWAKGLWQQADGADSCLFLRTDKPLKSTYVFQCRSLGVGALFLTETDTLIGVMGQEDRVGRFVKIAPTGPEQMGITVIDLDGTPAAQQVFRRAE